MQNAYMPLPFGREKQYPDRIIVHCMAEYIDTDGRDYSAVEFLNKIGLSVHALITPSGVVIRCRDDDQGAWHARGCNRDSLGVEILVPGLHTYESFLTAIKTHYCSPEQYDSLKQLCVMWADTFGISLIDRHSDVSPGRKHDPGDGFPWASFIDEINLSTQS